VAFTEGGDDVDEVAQVAAEAVNFPDDQGVSWAQVDQAGVPLRAVGFGPGVVVGVGLQAVFGAQCVQLHPGVLVGGTDPRIADDVSHDDGLYRKPPTASVS